MKHFVILGGGISGLSTAWFLQKKFGNKIKISIVEKENYCGGHIDSTKKEDFFFELGPRAFRTSNSEELLQCIKELNIENKIIYSPPSSKKRYLWTNGKLQKLPNNPISFLTSKLTRKLPYVLIKEILKKPIQQEDETIYDFFTRRFNKNFAEEFIDPLTLGIYAGDIHKLSITSCFPTINQWEKEYGSIIRGAIKTKKKKKKKKGALFSLQGGMQTLVNALCNNINANIILSQPAKKLEFDKHKINIKLPNKNITADYVISTIPAKDLAPLMQPHDTNIYQILSSVKYNSIAVVCLGFNTTIHKKKGFGYLIPSKEKEEMLGAIWDSQLFPNHNNSSKQERFICMFSNKNCPQFNNYNENKFITLAKNYLKKHLNTDEEPEVTLAKIIPNAMPQYNIGHEKKINELEQRLKKHPNIKITGNSYRGISINEGIILAKKTINVFLNNVT